MGMHGQFNPDYGFGAYGNEQRPFFRWTSNNKIRRKWKKRAYRRARHEAKAELCRLQRGAES